MVRITTNSILYNYQTGLAKSSLALYKARNTVLSGRNFNSYAEDPAAATKAFQLRRAYSRTSTQIDTSNEVISKFESAWSTMDTVISDLTNSQAKVSALSGVSDSTASGRNALGEVLTQTAESIISSMNAKYNNSYIFAGADGLNVPFTLDETTGELLYCGVSVDTDDSDTLAQLEAMNDEALYLDIGVGMKEDEDGNLISSSAFDSSISGIDMLGYGVDEDGDPKNLISIIKELGEIFSRCDSSSGDYASTEDEEAATRLTTKLESALASATSKYSELDTKSSYLDSNLDTLTEASETLNEQISNLEDCDLAAAISSFSWAQYCYNAALKVGNSILSESLMDYLT